MIWVLAERLRRGSKAKFVSEIIHGLYDHPRPVPQRAQGSLIGQRMDADLALAASSRQHVRIPCCDEA